jgi:hypothetical protein
VQKKVPLQPIHPSSPFRPSGQQLVITEESAEQIKQEASQSINEMSKDLLREIQSLEPDYEQRKLAIEVSLFLSFQFTSSF